MSLEYRFCKAGSAYPSRPVNWHWADGFHATACPRLAHSRGCSAALLRGTHTWTSASSNKAEALLESSLFRITSPPLAPLAYRHRPGICHTHAPRTLARGPNKGLFRK